MTQIDIFGTYHIDRHSKVEQELREFSSGTDIFFSEQPREAVGVFEWAELLGWNPAMFISGWCLNIFWGALGFVLTRHFDSVDSVAMKKIARERGTPIEQVDMNLVQELSDISLVFTACSWIWALFVIGVFFFAIVVYPTTLVVNGIPFSWIFFASAAYGLGLLPVVGFARISLPDRNKVMANNIEQVLNAQEGVEQGCLVVGYKHADGIADELRDRGFEVDNSFNSKWFRRSLSQSSG